MRLRVLNLPVLVAGLLVTAWTPLARQTRKIDDAALGNASKNTNEWLTISRDYSEQRYSPLTQITAVNVQRLGLAWSYEVGRGGGAQQATPLMADGILYGITNWSIVFALDARTGHERWRHDPNVDRSIAASGTSRLCCGVNSRGVALYEGKVIVPVIDGRLQALDAATGKLLWSVMTVPSDSVSYSITMAPRVAKGKIFIGNAGGEFPPYRGYLSAFDVNSGRELWRFYTTPGDPSKPFENEAMEKAAKTWTGDWWKLGGGGSIWDGMAYDPEANLVYVGTGNGTPWSQDVRQGKSTEHLDNLYIASILAIDAASGRLKWHFQCTPADQWDFDAVQHLMLADLEIGGRARKVILQANKNGYFYVIDRLSGEFISGEPMVPVSWARGLDPKTGRPIVNDEAHYTAERGVTVSPLQAHNTAQMAFNPATGLVYVPLASATSFSFTATNNFQLTPGVQAWGLRGRGDTGERPPIAVPPAYGPDRGLARGNSGILSAWDPVARKERWYTVGGGQSGGGALSTASNLVFQVTPQGRLLVYTADKGEKLLDIASGQTTGMGPPMTYLLDGKQYIAFMGGRGILAGGRGIPPPAEPTAGAAAPTPPAAPAPQTLLPRLYVYTLDPVVSRPPQELPPAPGKLIDVGGRRLHLMCSGQGAPTVVLEAGASSFAIDWTLVQRDVERTNRVCSYDRAGMGWSDPAKDSTRRSAAQDLRDLLKAAGERPPYVLVGASRGGLLVRAYLLDYPDDVIGLVLVDPSSEDRLFTMLDGQGVLIASLTAEQLRSTMPREPVPVPRRSPQTGSPFDRLPPELYKVRIMLDERLIASVPDTVAADVVASAQEAERAFLARLLASRSPAHPLGDRPTVVLSRGDEKNEAREKVHANLAALSTNSRHSVVAGSGHEIHLFEPATVVQGITDVLQAIRGRTRLPPR
jgi:quinohemoprotein ethanol dehydrogenase